MKTKYGSRIPGIPQDAGPRGLNDECGLKMLTASRRKAAVSIWASCLGALFDCPTARPVIVAAALLVTVVASRAQAPGVEIVRDRGEPFEILIKKANELREADALLSLETVSNQMDRASCELKLPKPAKKRLSDRELWRRSRDAHVRVGWHYLCRKCSKWHQNLAGGYFITADGAIATCHHVINPGRDYREGYLVAATESGELLAVTEILASDAVTDTAIIRAKLVAPVKPLALNTNVYPGDGAWCYSDPLGRSSYFSKGIVNRFFFLKRRSVESARMEVSTDWAPGSSGAAVLDECANAIGHVSEISTGRSASRSRGTNQTAFASSSMIVFHYAARAADVLALVKSPK